MPQRSRYIEGHKLRPFGDTLWCNKCNEYASQFCTEMHDEYVVPKERNQPIPCSPDFVGVIGQVYEEGKDYSLREVWYSLSDNPEWFAFPIKEEESQDELWEEVADHIRNLTYNQQDENRIASILKSKFHITRKQ